MPPGNLAPDDDAVYLLNLRNFLLSHIHDREKENASQEVFRTGKLEQEKADECRYFLKCIRVSQIPKYLSGCLGIKLLSNTQVFGCSVRTY